MDMIKSFDEFVSERETIEEGKLKDIALAASVAANLLFGVQYFRNHPEERRPEQEKREQTASAPDYEKDYYPSDEILEFIKKSEGWHKKWEKDPKGIKTTGWGFRYTSDLAKKYPDGMTREQADRYFNDVAVPERVKLFRKSVPNINSYTQRQLDALFDLYYNVGHKTFKFGSPKLQKALAEVDYDSIVKNMDHDYNRKNMSGARVRRDFERELFMQDAPTRIDGDDKVYDGNEWYYE